MLLAIPYFKGGSNNIFGRRTMSIQAVVRKANGGIRGNISEFF
jgi:hypothetical protein